MEQYLRSVDIDDGGQEQVGQLGADLLRRNRLSVWFGERRKTGQNTFPAQNLPGLFAAMGGDSAAIANLNEFFSAVPEAVTEPFYTPGNEEDLMAPWEYDATSAPWDTQALTRTLLDNFYGITLERFSGHHPW